MSNSKPPRPARKETSFEDAIALHPIDGSTTSFSANIPWDWASNVSAHGGFTASLIMAAARTYFTTTHPSRSQPDPISSTFNFLFPVPYGPVKLSIKELSLGSNYSTIQVELEGQVMEKMRAVPDKRRTCTLATIIMGNLAGEKGMTLPTTPILRKEALPDRTHWIESIRPNSMRKVFPIVFKTRRWLGTTDPIVTKTLAEKSMRGLWTSRWDGKGWDVLELGFVCDLFQPAPYLYFPSSEQVEWGISWPTLSMAMEIKRDPKDCKFLYLKLVTYEIRNGRFDTDVLAYNEEGELIATARHVSLVKGPAKKNEEWERALAKVLKL